MCIKLNFIRFLNAYGDLGNGFRLVIVKIFNLFFQGVSLPLNRQIIFITAFFRIYPVRKHIILEECILE